MNKEGLERAELLISYIRVLSKGYVKPDVQRDTSNTTGVVMDTKKYFKYINAANEALVEILELEDYLDDFTNH